MSGRKTAPGTEQEPGDADAREIPQKARRKRGETRQRILELAAELGREGGMQALTFDAIAHRLKMTKQAVLYWFPSKSDLLAGLALPILQHEVETVIDAVNSAGADRGEVARAVVRALIRFHTADLARFRLIYLVPQFGLRRSHGADADALTEQVHPITSTMYDAIARALGGGEEARADAVALHMAALGHVLMVSLTDALDDPLRHDPHLLGERLAGLLAAGIGAETGGISPRSDTDLDL